MSAKPIKFSKQFQVDAAKLSELGVFDPILNHDTRLFTEPLLLKDSSCQLMRDAFVAYKKYFADLMRLLKLSERIGDRCWRAAKDKVHFPEYKFTCIGYGRGTIKGAGSGAVLNDKILESAKEIITLAENDPSIFLLLPLLEDGIGADIISDMTQNIIDDHICEYTVEIMRQLGIKGIHKHYSKNKKLYYLPYNPYHRCVIKLLPLDIMSNLPLAEKFDKWAVGLIEENQVLRSTVNDLIGSTWFDTSKAEKKETILALIKKDKPFFLNVLGSLLNEKFKPYDLEKDYEGLYRWLEDSKIISKIIDFEYKRLDVNRSLSETIGFIIQDFKILIEQQELWRLFWTEINKKRKHVKEFYSQMLFYMVSSAWISGQENKITVNRIFNKDSKQLEIVFTIPAQQKVKVQLKHSNGSGLKKSYEVQLAQCESKGIQCYYIVLDFMQNKAPQFEYILEIEDPLCKIIEIDDCFRHQNNIGITDDIVDSDLGDLTTEYFDIEDDHYIKEKRKGGESSYQIYGLLREKVEEICMSEMEKKHYKSARSLCHVVAAVIEEHHNDLLLNFCPYKMSLRDGIDWRYPTFYNWCNGHFKKKENLKAITQTNKNQIEYC